MARVSRCVKKVKGMKMVQTVIAGAIIYYLQLEYWWWILLVIAIAIDINNEYVNNINSSNTVNRLNDIKDELLSINKILDKIKKKTPKGN